MRNSKIETPLSRNDHVCSEILSTLFLLFFAKKTDCIMRKLEHFYGGIIMRFREVEKNIENEKLNENKKEEEFKKIKPETNMTMEEAEAFWNDIFASIRES